MEVRNILLLYIATQFCYLQFNNSTSGGGYPVP